MSSDGVRLAGSLDDRVAIHMIRQQPRAVLRMCDAHQQIIDEHQPHPTLLDACSTCCTPTSNHATGDWSYADYPCPTIRALAAGYSLTEEDTHA